jgi:V/A-type H+/Na+-transporting ATPase subunit D
MAERADVAATRVALLELRDERRLVQEGYELLDEKRILLATETLRQLREHAALQARLDAQWATARQALASAIETHGFDDLTVEPPCSLEDALLRVGQQSFLGIALLDAHCDATPCVTVAQAVRDTPELRRCALAFRALALDLVTQAACAANLRRLMDEYQRTERRARALENVLLPEIAQSLHYIEDQLDAVDQEEAVRVRNAAKSR